MRTYSPVTMNTIITTTTTGIFILRGGLSHIKTKRKARIEKCGLFLAKNQESCMRVLKFGGTSVANAERVLNVADIAEKKREQGQVALVLSAPAKITNYLVAMIEKRQKEKNLSLKYEKQSKSSLIYCKVYEKINLVLITKA